MVMEIIKMVRLKFSIMLFAALISYKASAGCDPCIQASAEAAKAAMTSSLQTLNSTAEQTNSSVQTLNQTIEASNQALTGLMQVQSQQLMTSLDAASIRQELSTSAVGKTVERTTDLITNTIVETLRNKHKLEQISDTDDLYSMDKAQPISGVIAGARAPHLKDAIKQRQKLIQENDNSFYSWLNLTDNQDSSQGQRAALSMTKIGKLRKHLVGLNATVLTEDDATNLTQLLRLLVNPAPEPAPKVEDVLSGGPAAVDRELKRVRSNTKDAIIFSILSRQLANKAPILKTEEWKTGYVVVNESEPGLTSIDEMFESETLRKLLSEAWIRDLMEKTEASALREQVYQNNINNMLLSELIKQEQQTLLLLSMMATK